MGWRSPQTEHYTTPRWRAPWTRPIEPRVVQQTGMLEIRTDRAAVVTINDGRGYDVLPGQALRWEAMPVGVHTIKATPFVDGWLAPGQAWTAVAEVAAGAWTIIEIDWLPQVSQKMRVDLGEGAVLELVWIPPGRFWMGSPPEEEYRARDETRHEVIFTNGFWLGKFEVTQAQWVALMGTNPSHHRGSRRPVEMVNWQDAQDFIAALNARSRDGGFRLPTEAEWEYACRAGTLTPFHTGKTIDANQANFDAVQYYGDNEVGVFRNRTMDVGSFAPNAWGLHDMHGNVAEWCADWFGDYDERLVIHPRGPRQGPGRVIRGGGYQAPAWAIRSAARQAAWWEQVATHVGFRVARDQPEPRVSPARTFGPEPRRQRSPTR